MPLDLLLAPCACFFLTGCLALVQVSPQLEGSSLLTVAAAPSGMTTEALQAAHSQWHKADSYYYMSIARMQRLWEVSAWDGYSGFWRLGLVCTIPASG